LELKYVNCAAALLGLCMIAPAGAQGYPARTIRIVVPLAPGGGTDTLTRIISPRVGQILGQQVIVENRPGGASQIGTDHVAKAAPDGYTILHVDASFSTNPSLYAKLPYDSVKDFAPVSLLASATVVLTVHPSVPVHNLKQLLALARARPGELNFAVGGYGTGTHLSAELFKSVAKIDFVIVPYKGGGPAVAETVAGQVTMPRTFAMKWRNGPKW
jgi:tripartite-type tricarboxylate transporter receptor subunit TctC